MAREFKEVAHNRTDKKKFEENFDLIKGGSKLDTGSYVFRNGEMVKLSETEAVKHKKHVTAGICGEYGMSEQTSRGGFGPGIEHKEPERFSCQVCGYQENRFPEFCENCIG